ncbi:CD276 antigen homolog [Siniperca chuatsi]|uniref:CD276 antigen homolog n=1 Tax=Siniperca chuatsi TaxID=119488 RepID=UPI001CE0F21B|nr:CD276 antigen homolog [Siniperca chuatsi]
MGGLTRFGEFLLWLFLVYRMKTVTCQVNVVGFIGDTVLLPCFYSDVSALKDPFSVFWRDKDNSNVLDIKDNAPDISAQGAKFKNRVSSFQELYKKGNFSITVKNVQQSDSGTYECHIRSVDFEQRVSLSVSGKRVVAATPPPGPAGGAVVTPNSLHIILLSVPLSLLLSYIN